MSKIEKLRSLIVENNEIGMELVREVNFWDSSLDYLNVYYMDELDELLDGLTPTEILNKMHFGKFNPTSSFFRFDGYMNLESLDMWEYERDICEYALDIAERFTKLYKDFNVDTTFEEVKEILDEE